MIALPLAICSLLACSLQDQNASMPVRNSSPKSFDPAARDPKVQNFALNARGDVVTHDKVLSIVIECKHYPGYNADQPPIILQKKDYPDFLSSFFGSEPQLFKGAILALVTKIVEIRFRSPLSGEEETRTFTLLNDQFVKDSATGMYYRTRPTLQQLIQ